MIPYIYCTLMTVMLLLLYWAGKQLKNDYRLSSLPGVVAILVFTLNEGLRFGRGIDYNHYWQVYMDLAHGWDNNQDIGYLLIERTFLFLGLPFQALVIFMSFMFIFSSLLLMRHYKYIVMYALPLWIYYSKEPVGNMLRWYLAFSFILIGFSYLLSDNKYRLRYYMLYSLIGCTIHYAIAPIPIIFYLISFRKEPFLSPKIAVAAFISVVLLFKTEMMLRFVDLMNNLSFLSNISEKFNGYIENAEFWLTNNALGKTSGPSKFDIIQFSFLLIVGHKCCKINGSKYILAYNLFLIGVLLYTMGIQLELAARYMRIFYFFGAIVFGNIIKMTQFRLIPYRNIVLPLILLFLIFPFYSALKIPFKKHPKLSMYVWDHKNETPDAMYNIYLNQKYKDNKNFETKDERRQQLKK